MPATASVIDDVAAHNVPDISAVTDVGAMLVRLIESNAKCRYLKIDL
jgi:hypothetical protein